MGSTPSGIPEVIYALSSSASLPILRRPHLELEEDLAQLNPIPVAQFATMGHRGAVDQGVLGGGPVVDQQVAVALPLDHRVLLLDLHVAEQGDVGVLVAAEQVVLLVEGVF